MAIGAHGQDRLRLGEEDRLVAPHRKAHGLRQGDGGLLLLDAPGELSVPVSRSHVREVLTLLEGRPGHEAPMSQAAPA
jgi:hypothetical protein